MTTGKWLLTQDAEVDHFRVIRPLGRGSTAEVYLARDESLGRKVALKVMRPEAMGSKEAVERSLQEARATARFSHPHIVAIHAVGQSDGRPYLALEYLEGESLRERLEGELPSTAETIRIGLAICEALGVAHQAGVLHRDLKPENVIMAKDGRPRVLDFGLAGFKRADDSRMPSQPGATSSQGTPGYMAPEQWKGTQTSGATDVWALGIILHELIVGHRPIEEPSLVDQATRVCDPEPVPRIDNTLEVRPDLVDLVGRCLEKDPSARPTSGEVARELRRMLVIDRDEGAQEESPFRGLMAFHEQHRQFFFGRETEIAACAERLRIQPVLPLVGPSGAGKSSLVQAGLIPRLRERGPLVVLQLRPGSDPFRALALRIVAARKQATGYDTGQDPDAQRLGSQLVASPTLLNIMLHRLAERRRSTVLLFVDQLEELVTLVEDEETRRGFMQAICSAADDPEMPVRVVLTLREEFLSRLAVGPGVREALGQVTVLRSPGPEALQEIVSEPLKLVGYDYDDPELPGDMVAEVQGEASCLPLLQFAGSLLWQRRDKNGRQLRRSVYQDMGGVVGALAKHADGVLSGLSQDEIALTRSLLLRMVTDEGTRRVLSREDLLDGLATGADDVLSRLTEARLVTSRQSEDEGLSQLELVHESLVVTWGRLSRWIDESSEELRFLNEIGQAADLWAKRGQRDEEAWQGHTLYEAKRAIQHCTTDVSSLVKRFLAASQRKEKGRIWRRRGILAGVMALLATIAVVFFVKEQDTREQKEIVEQREAELLRQGASTSLDDGTLLDARAQLRSSLEGQDGTATRGLWARLRQEPLAWRRKLPGSVFRVTFSQDSRTLTFGVAGVWSNSSFDTIHRLDVRSADTQRLKVDAGAFPTDPGPDLGTFSRDAKQLAVVSDNGEVTLWDIGNQTSRVVGRHPTGVSRPRFSRSGDHLATAGQDGTVRIWSLTTEAPPAVLDPKAGKASVLGFSHDDRLLVTRHERSSGASIRFWDIESRAERKAIKSRSYVWLSKDGRELHGINYPGSDRATIQRWDLDSTELIAEFGFYKRGYLNNFGISPDRTYRVNLVNDGTVRISDPSTGKPIRSVRGPCDPNGLLSFSPDGSRFLTGYRDSTLRVWDPRDLRMTGTVQACTGSSLHEIPRPEFSPDGRWLLTGCFDKSIQLWNTAVLEQPKPLKPHASSLAGIAVDREHNLIASIGLQDGTLRLWDFTSGAVTAVLETPGMGFGIDLSPDGQRLASTHGDMTIRLWDTHSGKEIRVLRGHEGTVTDVKWSPDGHRLVSGSTDRTLRLWDPATGEQKRSYSVAGQGHAHCGVAFSPDGNLLAASGMPTPRVFEVSTGRERKLARRGDKTWFFPLAFGPDSRQLVAGAMEGTLEAWDLTTGEHRIIGRGNAGSSVTFHPDGKRIGTGDISDNQARIWNLATGKESVLGHGPSGGSSLVFTRDGKLAVTASQDGTLRIWHTDSGLPFWRAPVLLPRSDGSAWLFSHLGWSRLGGKHSDSATPPAAKWREAAESSRYGVQSVDESTLCLQTFNKHLQLWDLKAGLLEWDRKIGEPADLVAVPGGCVTRSNGAVSLFTTTGARHELCSTASALAWSGGALLVACGDELRVLDPAGKQRAWHPVEEGATAVAQGDKSIILSYGAGVIRVLTGQLEVMLDDSPPSTVRRLAAGPGNTIILGHDNGVVGLWDLHTGLKLAEAHLHGPAVHLVQHRGSLYAATDLGDHLTWDLGVYEREYCDLLREVWNQVPVVWRDGHAVPAAPPPDHTCSATRNL